MAQLNHTLNTAANWSQHVASKPVPDPIPHLQLAVSDNTTSTPSRPLVASIEVKIAIAESSIREAETARRWERHHAEMKKHFIADYGIIGGYLKHWDATWGKDFTDGAGKVLFIGANCIPTVAFANLATGTFTGHDAWGNEMGGWDYAGYAAGAFGGFGGGVGNLKVPIYRVYGGGASMYGRSYSLINPQYVPFYRNFAGLPNLNTGQFLLKGTIPIREIKVGRWFAASLDGNTGGLPFELYQNYNQLRNPVNIIIKKPF
jgi:hypothetical protein